MPALFAYYKAVLFRHCMADFFFTIVWQYNVPLLFCVY